MRRLALGVIALALLAGGIAGLIANGGVEQTGGAAASAAIRAGALLAAIWLAMPQLERLLQRFPPWLLGGCAVGALLLILRPKLILYLAPLAAILAALQFVTILFRPHVKSPASRVANAGSTSLEARKRAAESRRERGASSEPDRT